MVEDSIELSFVIPVYNEVESLDELYEKLVLTLHGLPEVSKYELIFIDDGSTDGSGQRLLNLAKEDKNVKVLILRQNYGKSIALQAGFDKAIGKYIFTMDADLQDDPEEIPHFIQKIKEGWDLVSGWKFKRNDPFEKRFASKIFNAVVSMVFNIKIHDFNCGFKMYRREVLKTVNLISEFYRYIPVLAKMSGFKITEIKVKHHKRKNGVSKFGYKRYLNGLFDFVLMFFIYFLGKISFKAFFLFEMFLLGAGAVCSFFSGLSAIVCFCFMLVFLIIYLITSKIKSVYSEKKEINKYISENA